MTDVAAASACVTLKIDAYYIWVVFRLMLIMSNKKYVDITTRYAVYAVFHRTPQSSG
jgi:hypothetical protein